VDIRVQRAVLWLAVLCALGSLAGCGGSGGSVGNTPDPTLFTPNYVSSLDGLYHWNHLPVRIAFANPPAGWTAKPALYAAATAEWNQPGKTALATVVSYGSSADVTVEFVHYTDSDLLSHGPGTQGLTTSSYYTNGVMASAQIKVALDTAYVASVSDAEAQTTIAHEIGHGLGIIGHSPYPDDLMYMSHTYGDSVTPSTRDFNTIMTAYPSYFGRATRAIEVPVGPLMTTTIE